MYFDDDLPKTPEQRSLKCCENLPLIAFDIAFENEVRVAADMAISFHQRRQRRQSRIL